MPPQFVHLRLHTEYSLIDSVIRIPQLMKSVSDTGMPAVAITDECNLFAMLKAYRAALKSGIKPIIGADLWTIDDDSNRPTLLTLLCQDRSGFLNLSRLITRSFLEGQHRGHPRISSEWLTPESCAGLIALSGGHRGALSYALSMGRRRDRDALVQRFRSLFPERYYIEVSRTGQDGEDDYLHRAVPLASEAGLPVVATNDVRFLRPEDFDAHEARVCIQSGHTLTDTRRPRPYTRDQYLRTPVEMEQLFADLPEAIANSVAIAMRCSLDIVLGESHLPAYPMPADKTEATLLRENARAGLEQRLALSGSRDRARYEQRLQMELDVIERMGFPGYFLIVADFIGWARKNQVPVGPGRGSGAGSLVAYCLRITDLDPLTHDLLFERFLNPERVSMPDFDIDFCMSGRDRVIEYVAARYGRDRVSQIITYGTMAARAVVRDVGRVLGHPYGFVDRIAKLIPFEIGMTLDQALEDAELRRLYNDDDEIRTLIDLARRLEGLARNAGKHAGGVVIAPAPLTEFTPLYCEDGGTHPVTQLDKDDVEAAGLVKFDFLGLKTLTVIDWTVQTINEARAAAGEPALSLENIEDGDAAAFDLLKRCQSTAVFQLESRGMKDLIKRLQPDRFEDIVALVALFRPGPLQSGMVDDFIKRKHGEAPIDYPHLALKTILEPTYGVILYQEQVMQIAQELAGYSLGAADLLRRAMGKKKPEEMRKQRSVFLEGSRARGVDEIVANNIFDLMEKFAGYGFNKSHSAAYAVLSYQTAWLKAHYPAAFMSAVLSADMDNTDKIVTLIEECTNLHLDVLSPDINESVYAFGVAGGDSIRYGLGAIKGAGRSAVQALVDERAANGRYSDLDDLCQRADLQRANKRVFEALIKSGALDSLGANRATLLANLADALKAAEQSARAAAAGQEDLFGGTAEKSEQAPVRRYRQIDEMTEADRLAAEKEALGLWLTGHPIDAYRHELDALTGAPLAEQVGSAPSHNGSGRDPGRSVVLGGLIADMRRRGNRVSLILDDRSARVEVTVFEEIYQRIRHWLAKDRIVLVEGKLRFDDFLNDWRLSARELEPLERVRERLAVQVNILWPEGGDEEGLVERLRETLSPYRGGRCQIKIAYRGSAARAELALGDEWAVRPAAELLRSLIHLVGDGGYRILYAPGGYRATTRSDRPGAVALEAQSVN